ncbi:MAG: hypothetical protein WC628_06505 [Candidatus Omnitrophota bacterium]
MKLMKNIMVITFLLFIGCQSVYATSINWATDSVSTKTGGGAGNNGSEGDPSLVFDEDDNTYYKWLNTAVGSSTSSAWTQSEFLKARSINKIKAVFKCLDSPFFKSGTYLIEIYDGGFWKTVGSGNLDKTKQTVEYEDLSYNFATKVKLTVTATSVSIFLGVVIAAKSEVWLYELCAWGRDYIDTGFRFYDGKSVVKIGCKILSATDKLRIRKDNTTYGIYLLESGDADSSAFRIYDGTSVKALPKIE